MTSSSLSALLHLHGLPPLPRSLTGFVPQGQGLPYYGSSLTPHLRNELMPSTKSSHGHVHVIHGRPSPPAPTRPHSRRSSSSGSSFRASPDHVSNRSTIIEPMRSSPRSLSSSPHSPHIDSGLGRSSADSFSESRAFVRVVKSPLGVGTRLDAQLAQLKRDMHHLRQQDMALLGHLLQIHQGIQDLKNVLVPPPQPAPSGPLPMFHSTPSYPSHNSSSSSSSSRHGRKNHSSYSQQPQQQHSTSRLSMLTGSKLFSRRSSSEKMMIESMTMGIELGACGGGLPHSHNRGSRAHEDESDSLSSLEFGDV